MRDSNLINRWLPEPVSPAPHRLHGATPLAPFLSANKVTERPARTEKPPRLRLVPSLPQSCGRANAQSTQNDRRGPKTGRPTKSLQHPAQADQSERDILGCLRPVDWASVHTLARLTGVPYETVLQHLHNLESRGTVAIGQRLVQPEVRTVAWLTHDNDSSGGAA